MAAAVALVAEALALAPMAVVSAAEGLEELAVLVALVVEVLLTWMVLMLVVSFESEAVSAGRRAAELEIGRASCRERVLRLV